MNKSISIQIIASFAAAALAACAPKAETKSAAAEDTSRFFHVETNGTGPLTMAELQIDIPDDLEKRMSSERKTCFLRKIEELAAAAGDPETLKTEDVAFLPDQETWDPLPRYNKRLLLAQAVVSRAITLCP